MPVAMLLILIICQHEHDVGRAVDLRGIGPVCGMDRQENRNRDKHVRGTRAQETDNQFTRTSAGTRGAHLVAPMVAGSKCRGTAPQYPRIARAPADPQPSLRRGTRALPLGDIGHAAGLHQPTVEPVVRALVVMVLVARPPEQIPVVRSFRPSRTNWAARKLPRLCEQNGGGGQFSRRDEPAESD